MAAQGTGGIPWWGRRSSGTARSKTNSGSRVLAGKRVLLGVETLGSAPSLPTFHTASRGDRGWTGRLGHALRAGLPAGRDRTPPCPFSGAEEEEEELAQHRQNRRLHATPRESPVLPGQAAQEEPGAVAEGEGSPPRRRPWARQCRQASRHLRAKNHPIQLILR